MPGPFTIDSRPRKGERGGEGRCNVKRGIILLMVVGLFSSPHVYTNMRHFALRGRKVWHFLQ